MVNVMCGVRATMKLSLIVLLLFSFLLSQLNCRSLDTRADKGPVNKCQEDLKRIPEIATLLKPRARAEGEEEEKPLKGLEVALTINGMIRSQSNFDDDIDNSCESENTRENFEKLLTALKPSSSEGIPEQPQTNSSTQHLSNSPLRSILLPARRSSA